MRDQQTHHVESMMSLALLNRTRRIAILIGRCDTKCLPNTTNILTNHVSQQMQQCDSGQPPPKQSTRSPQWQVLHRCARDNQLIAGYRIHASCHKGHDSVKW